MTMHGTQAIQPTIGGISSISGQYGTWTTPVPKAATVAQLPAQEITLGMPDYQPWIETLKPMLGDDFKSSQPNVKVTVNQYPVSEMRTKYRLLATSGTPLDVSWICCGDVASFGECKLAW